ncbi:hypothetical protein J1N35_007526, partial [Gossypium stocksii]
MEYWKWLGIIVVALIMLVGGWRTEGCLEEERLAFFQLKPFFPSINSSIDDSWLEYEPMGYPIEEDVTSSDCCEWEKVECSSITGHVTHLFLNLTYTVIFDDLEYRVPENNKYCDSILTSLSELSSLKSLNLASNKFTGSNPTNGLKRLSKLKNLEILDLSHHKYIGNISSQLNDFSSLKSQFKGGHSCERSVYAGSEILLGNNEAGLRLMNLTVLHLDFNLFNNTMSSSLKSKDFVFRRLQFGRKNLSSSVSTSTYTNKLYFNSIIFQCLILLRIKWIEQFGDTV